MRISRIYIDQPLAVGANITLEGDRAHYIRNVLRLKSGAGISLFNGSDDSDYHSIVHFRGKNIEVDIISAHSTVVDSALDTEVILGVSRSDRIDFSIQKCTELGVTRISVFNAQHSQNPIKPTQLDKRITHWRAVAIKACEQCGRHHIPEISFYNQIDRALDNSFPEAAKYVLDFSGIALSKLLSNTASNQRVALLTGPEGGLSKEEISLATDHQFLPAQIGPRVLRTETAAIAGLTIVQSLQGDLAG